MDSNSNSKKCRYCGKELPQEAIFCYYCKRELVTRPERPVVEEKKSKLPWWVWVVILVIALVIVFMVQ